MTDVIDKAQAPDTFDVLSFLEGTAYPTQEVTVFTDPKSAAELLALNAKRQELDKTGQPIDDELENQISALAEKIQAGALTFELRGMPPGLVQELYNVTEETTQDEEFASEDKLIAGTIVGVRNAQGIKDSRLWDEEAVGKARHFLKEGEFRKLIEGVIAVNFNAIVFDQATDAGFLSRSSYLES